MTVSAEGLNDCQSGVRCRAHSPAMITGLTAAHGRSVGSALRLTSWGRTSAILGRFHDTGDRSEAMAGTMLPCGVHIG
jgi:hypothetical protein